MTEQNHEAAEVTQADIDCRNAIYLELTGLRVADDIAAQPDWMDKYISAHRQASEVRMISKLQSEEARERIQDCGPIGCCSISDKAADEILASVVEMLGEKS